MSKDLTDILIRKDGHAGRITLNRPEALNAATYDMLRAIEAAVDGWRQDDAVRLVIIDAAGERAFCSGGDIADLYAAGRAGDFAFGRTFWRDEYRLNAKLAQFPKPIVTFLQGFTMGGGVGIGCHASHRIVGETSKIAMPECGIGLVPDVGGSLMLARAPGRLGDYLGLTGARMGPGDAIYAGFADQFVPQADWDAVKAALCDSGDPAVIPGHPAPMSPLADQTAEIERLFRASDLASLTTTLDAADSDIAEAARKGLTRNSPLSMAAALILIDRVRADPTIQNALTNEYRFTWRASEQGDFLEGVRAAIIDKDRSPNWQHSLLGVTSAEAQAMMAPLGDNDLTWE